MAPLPSVGLTSLNLVRAAMGDMGKSDGPAMRSCLAALHIASASSWCGPQAAAQAQDSGSQKPSMQPRACKRAAT